MIERVLLATTNSGKMEEIRAALAGLDVELIGAEAWGDLPAPEETGASFAANARLKALHYRQLTGLPALADDSGLEVDALNGGPGIHSARYAATDGARIRRLLRELSQLDPPLRGKPAARFVCALCLAHDGGALEVEGEVRGFISRRPHGTNGFGYDPVFFYPPLAKTFGQLDRSIKNTVSHRAAALRKLRERLAAEIP